MSHSTPLSEDYPKSDIMGDSMIIFNGKENLYLDCNVPQQLSTEISGCVEFLFWQVLDLLDITIIRVLSVNTVSLLFLQMKTEARKSLIVCRVSFQRPQRIWCVVFQTLTSNCCPVFFLSTHRVTLWLICACTKTDWKTLFESLFGYRKKAAYFKTLKKTSTDWKQEGPLIIQLSNLRFLSIRSTGCWRQLVSLAVLQLETAVMSATCAAITSRAGNC